MRSVKTMLTVKRAPGTEVTVTLPGPGGVERFAAGERGCRSGVWRIWATRHKSDVYAGIRDLTGVQKWSLHESGDWRHQWVGEHGKAALAWTGTRVIDSWARPPELGAGWTRALVIWVPDTDIIAVPDDRQGRGDIAWVPAPPPGHAHAFLVMIGRPDQGQLEIRRATPIGGFVLANGQSVVIFVQPVQISDQNRVWLAEQRDTTLSMTARAGIRLEDTDAPRITLSGYDAVGGRMIWDLAAFPEADPN